MPYVGNDIRQMNEESFSKILNGQMDTFIRWCDDADLNTLFLQDVEVKDILRLCNIALQIHFPILTIYLIWRIEKAGVKKVTDFMNAYPDGELGQELLKAWLSDFIKKQPPGKNRNRLLKRLYKYGI